jgi:MoaA/NifB/PqqE/SkfB family radical SAM enzyme
VSRLEESLTHLDINLGDACNLRCVHCPCWITAGAPRFDPDVLEQRLTEAVEYVTSECPKFDKAMLIGGEPLVHKGVEQFLERQRLDANVYVYTNFVWPDPTLSLPPNVYFLSSLDAPNYDVYAHLRRTKDFELSQAVMRRNSANLIHVDTTVSKTNLPVLDEILDITEPYGCTHWLLPVDPRMLRYARERNGHSDPESQREGAMAWRTARRLEQILLDEDDLAIVEDFYDRRGSERTNDYGMFLGVYLAGVDHFKEDEFDYRDDLDVSRPEVGAARCAGIRRYMEIGFVDDGRFLPMVHCPELWDVLGTHTAAPVDSFADLMGWENEVRALPRCERFCGRTQFLGLDEYQDTFQHVHANA